MLARATVVFY